MLYGLIFASALTVDGIARPVEQCRAGWESGQQVFVSQDAVCIMGPIRPGAEGIMESGLIGENPRSVIVAKSEGGDVRVALAIGEMISGSEISLIVDGYCLSSCANYILPAAKYKYILNDAIVGWHGGPARTVEEYARAMQATRPELSRKEAFSIADKEFPPIGDIIQRQNDLYAKAGASPKIMYDLSVAFRCIIGKSKNELLGIAQSARDEFWSPGPVTLMSHYGISNFIRLDAGRSNLSGDTIHVMWEDGGSADFAVDNACLYKGFAERDIREEYAARAPRIDAPISEWLALPEVQ